MKPQDFITSTGSKLNFGKLAKQDRSIFVQRVGSCLVNAKTEACKRMLYTTIVTYLHYDWMCFIDKNYRDYGIS